ncbi:MAG: hypothetical protein H0Z39_07175 [Peptococcaceae bacterium]|nr:hypothetical protein [Peptococcaceae bacterium]
MKCRRCGVEITDPLHRKDLDGLCINCYREELIAVYEKIQGRLRRNREQRKNQGEQDQKVFKADFSRFDGYSDCEGVNKQQVRDYFLAHCGEFAFRERVRVSSCDCGNKWFNLYEHTCDETFDASEGNLHPDETVIYVCECDECGAWAIGVAKEW